jgi:hypothetical protein
MNSKPLNVKITKLNRAERELKGTKVPEERYGNIGNHVEVSMIGMGYELDRRSSRPDLSKLRCDVKTRSTTATSAHTVGSMSLADIIATPYKDSSICAKTQYQFRVKHNQTFREIVHSKVYDFTLPEIQKSIEHAYETSREKIKEWYNCEGSLPRYIRAKDAECYWEQKEGECYAFRIPDGVMKKFETLFNVNKSFNDLFE